MVFFAKINKDGWRIWGSYLGGVAFDEASAITCDHADNILIVGRTGSDSSTIFSSNYQNIFKSCHQPERNSLLNDGFIFYFQNWDTIDVTYDLVSDTLCPADSFSITFQANGRISSLDTLIAQISPQQDFQQPITVGTQLGNNNGQIACVIPDPTMISPGQNYFFRVILNSPILRSLDSIQSIFIKDTINLRPQLSSKILCPPQPLSISFKETSRFSTNDSVIISLISGSGDTFSLPTISALDTLFEADLPPGITFGQYYQLTIQLTSPDICESMIQKEILIRDNSAEIGFEIISDTFICPGDPLIFTYHANGNFGEEDSLYFLLQNGVETYTLASIKAETIIKDTISTTIPLNIKSNSEYFIRAVLASELLCNNINQNISLNSKDSDIQFDDVSINQDSHCPGGTFILQYELSREPYAGDSLWIFLEDNQGKTYSILQKEAADSRGEELILTLPDLLSQNQIYLVKLLLISQSFCTPNIEEPLEIFIKGPEVCNDFRIYPNPATDNFYIRVNIDLLTPEKALVFNSLGQKIIEKDWPVGLDEVKICMNCGDIKVPFGFYFIRVIYYSEDNDHLPDSFPPRQPPWAKIAIYTIPKINL